MALQLPGIPDFRTNIAQMPSPAEQYGKMLQLRQLSGQVQQEQRMQPLQVQQAQQSVQASTLENQQRQQELESQKAMMRAWSDPDFLKGFTGTEGAQASGLGFDPNALTASLVSKGVLPKDAMGMTQSMIDRSAKMAETLKVQAQTGEANAAVRDKTTKILADKIGGILDMPASKAPDAFASLKQDLAKNPQAYPGVPKDDLASLYGADLEHLPAMATKLGFDAKIADFHKSKFEAQKAQQGVIPEGGGLSAEAQQQVQKDVAVATDPRVQANKIEVAKAEGIARQAIEGTVKPVYAVDAQGGKTLMSQTDAQKAGIKLTIPVTEKQVTDDTMLINRLGDVRQKLARYEQAFAAPISESDKYVIAKVLADDKFKLAGFGASLPVDFLNKLDQARNLGNISAEAQKKLIAYYNMREAMTGYNRVLTGSGRSSDKTLELQLETMPNPMAPDNFGKEAFGQFRENLGIVGQGLPKIPGVKSPDEIEAQVKSAAPAHKVGDVVVQGGHRFKATAVDSSGKVTAADPL